MDFHVSGTSVIGQAVALIQTTCNVGRTTAYTILLQTALDSRTDVHDTAGRLMSGVAS